MSVVPPTLPLTLWDRAQACIEGILGLREEALLGEKAAVVYVERSRDVCV
jgi:hypothetical protein